MAIEYGNRPFSKSEKEALKEAIDQSNNWEELLAVAIASLSLGNGYTNMQFGNTLAKKSDSQNKMWK